MIKGGEPWTIASNIEKAVDRECSVICSASPLATMGGCNEECMVDSDNMHCLVTIIEQEEAEEQNFAEVSTTPQ